MIDDQTLGRRDITRVVERDEPMMHVGPTTRAKLAHRLLDREYADLHFGELIAGMVMAT